MPLTGTIIELLTATSPELDLRYQPTGAVTQSHTYEPLAKAHVVPWPDFTYENIGIHMATFSRSALSSQTLSRTYAGL